MTLLETFFLLIGLHFVCDYPLQTEAMALGKDELTSPRYNVPWYYWLASHCATHAVAVGLCTRSVELGIMEFVFHYVIDMLKGSGRIGIHFDQFLHLLCKMFYIYLIYKGIGS